MSTALGPHVALKTGDELRALAEIEREAILHAIAHEDGNMSSVAVKLRIGRSTLYRKLREYTDAAIGRAR